MRIPKKVAERVARGAALLDEVMPGWASKIDLDRLDLASGSECVLGQVFATPRQVPYWQQAGFPSLAAARRERPRGNWTEKVCVANYDLGSIVLTYKKKLIAQYGGEQDAMMQHGFDADWNAQILYEDLDKAWAQEVKARQA